MTSAKSRRFRSSGLGTLRVVRLGRRDWAELAALGVPLLGLAPLVCLDGVEQLLAPEIAHFSTDVRGHVREHVGYELSAGHEPGLPFIGVAPDALIPRNRIAHQVRPGLTL